MYQLTAKEIFSCILLAAIAAPFIVYLVKERKNVKENYYSIRCATGYNMLSKEERKLYILLCSVTGDNAIALGIQDICNDGTVYRFRKMIIDLQQSGNDNPVLLKKILGEEVFSEVMMVAV